MPYRVGVDVGGTFTDFLLFEEATGAAAAHKTPSTPWDPAEGLIRGLGELLQNASVAPADVMHVMHGTTVSTNAVLEGRGARVGLLTTAGFEQVLHLARGETPGPMAGWVTMVKPDPLAAVEDTRGVRERMGARGEVVRPLDVEQARAAIEELVGRGVESLAISLINSYANPEHESRLRDLVREGHPDLSVSISSEVLPEFREYERTNVVVMNAYVRPRLEGYARRVRERLREMGVAGSISILRSDGGLMTVDSATRQPVHSLFSGPAGGVAGAVQIARAAGCPDFLSLDMGGTSTDVALCVGGEPILRREAQLGYFPLKVPAIDVRSVGAGGGSIAHVPHVTRALRVGPASAGAQPGPAAYGKGGTEPTVTDANLVLGYLPPELLGGAMKLDPEAARTAVGTVAQALGLSLEAAAEAIVDVRYHRQALEIPIEIDLEELERNGFAAVEERFAELHERQYAFRLDVVPEFVNARATALSEREVQHPRLPLARDGGGPPAPARRRIFHRGRWLDAALHQREWLRPGDRVDGPAIVTQVDSTTLVLPGHSAEVDAHHNLLIRPGAAASPARQADSPIVIDIIENALKNIRREMDAVIFRAAMSTVIREEHDSFPLLTDEQGRMVAGQFGWQLEEFFDHYPKERMGPGDVLILNDPYLCGGAVQHTPDMLVLRPLFYGDELVGFASQLGNLMDIGGPVAGSMPTAARSIFEEGIRFPPVKLYEGGRLVQAIVDILARNSRTPELTVADTLAMAAATRVAELRVVELCERFGVDTYRATLQKLLDRTRRAAELMIERFIPEQPLEFEDYVDDDGRGNGPFKIRMSMWREGGRAIIDSPARRPRPRARSTCSWASPCSR